MTATKTREPAPRRAIPAWLRRSPLWARYTALYALTLAALLAAGQLSLVSARVPLDVVITPKYGVFHVDGSQILLRWQQTPTQVMFLGHAPLLREFQIDGSDSINNASEDLAYLSTLADSPYYLFQSWMRDTSSYSSWRDLTLRDHSDGRVLLQRDAFRDTTTIALPPGRAVDVGVSIERPEVPLQILFLCQGVPCAQFIIDRNDRYALAENLFSGASTADTQSVYFPTQPGPFIAEIIYLLTRILLWSLLALGALVVMHLILIRLSDAVAGPMSNASRIIRSRLARRRFLDWSWAWRRRQWRFPGDRWDLLAAFSVIASLGFTLFVALAQYHAEPHILDASAYYFQAKIFASGRLAAPAPTNLNAFQGPFMVAYDGRWFAQYPPATSALLALGLLTHTPLLVEPLLGVLALWGVYRIGRRIFTPGVGLLAVVLGALSPFYTYLAASYLSHTVALFFAVYFLLFLLRFSATSHMRDLALAAICIGGLLLTRELSAVILGCGAVTYLGATQWHSYWRDRASVLPTALLAAAIVGFALWLYLLYNVLQTGSPFISPRNLFSPADQYGFGQGIGFYGQHTLAAGLVNLDQLLTILLIDLFGWPFYLTLAFVPLAFLRRSLSALYWELFCLLLGGALILAQVGYFYHGIYLGPRYLFEALPFLLLLTACGIIRAARFLLIMSNTAFSRLSTRYAVRAARASVALLTLALISCNLVYYLPRQIQLHTNFSGLPVSQPVDVAAIYQFHPANALVVTDNQAVYNNVLWPLNDPDLRGPTLYALASTPGTLTEIRREYPTRAVYLLHVSVTGHVSFVRSFP